MNQLARIMIVNVIFIITGIFTLGVQREHFEGTKILEKIQIPTALPGWASEDVSKNLNLQDDRFTFIDKIFAHIYQKTPAENLLFLAIDAGNFHYPKLCFSTSGFKVTELPDENLIFNNRTVKVKSMYVESARRNYLVLYWLCIDQKQLNWTEQKFYELWASMTHKRKAGLMIRIDIPTPQQLSIPTSLTLVEEFLKNLDQSMPEEQAAYLFGK